MVNGGNMMRKAVLTAALLGCAFSPVQAETLADAMVMAYRNSPELDTGRANVRVLSEQAIQARAQGRLQVQGTINLTSQFQNLREFIYPTTLQLDVTQPLYTGGQVENATEAARTRSRPNAPNSIRLCTTGPFLRAQAKWTRPSGFSGVPPPGPATPVMATERSARLCASAPSAMASATGSETAPCATISSMGTPIASALASFE